MVKPRYRPDIDGLRGLAVLLVVGFHAFPDLFGGGYVGVDVFFVISGFLITALLLQGLEQKRFSFAEFYGRRIKRIFPALIPVLGISLVAGWVLLVPRDFASLGLNTVGGAAFFSNLVALKETSYFGLTAGEKPLLHLWSLGIEEQFYILWPVLLLLAFSRRLSLAALAAALLLASFACNVLIAGSAADFYLPFTRAWELMAGAILAVVGRPSLIAALTLASKISAAHREWHAVMGLLLIVAGVIAANKNAGSFPGWWALLPCAGTALVISADGAWINRRILAHGAVVGIGLISYPIYLWHWPLLSFIAFAAPQPSWSLRAAAVVGAAILAWMTYRWIEQPIRTGSYRAWKIPALCIAMALVGSAGLVVFASRGIPDRIPAEIRDIADMPFDPEREHRQSRHDRCFFVTTQPRYAPECLERDVRPLLFLWGDSAAAALYPGLDHLRSSLSFGLAQYTLATCPPSLGAREVPYCGRNNEHVLAVLTDARPDIVLLHSTWARPNVVPSLRELIEKLRHLNVPRVVVMGPPAAWVHGLPNAAYRYYMLHAGQMIPLRSAFGVDKSEYDYQRHFREQVQAWDVEYVSAWDALCRGLECLTRVGEGGADLVVFDRSHLTVPGADYVARTIATCLFPDRIEQSASVPAPVGPSGVCSPRASTHQK
ncbi:MAG TPA: acyltransferase family protein [Xanthobacteraceae bacterium]|nr:acyltransferase family protein [Xanthobacteraceae bacterium]